MKNKGLLKQVIDKNVDKQGRVSPQLFLFLVLIAEIIFSVPIILTLINGCRW